MKKYLLLLLGMVTLTVGADGAAEKDRGNARIRRPNILWILLEDTNPYFGCYGDAINKGHTPTIDKMAESGVLFERCYMPAPVCSPCRSALIVGAMQTTTGTHNHRSARVNMNDKKASKDPQNLYPLPAPYKPIPQLMKEAGYHTFNRNKDDYNFTYHREDLYSSGNNSDKYPYPHNGWQGWYGRAGSWKDRKDKNQPWFGQIGLNGGKSNLKNLPASEKLASGSVELPPYYPDTPAFQFAWTHGWNACRMADLEVKRILENLKRDGELENTIVFFFSDHGDNLSLRHKQFCYEGGVQVPLVIQGNHPTIGKGVRRSEIISGLDISATTLALGGVKLPEYLEGHDLFASDYKPAEFVVSARDRCDFTIDRIRTIRTDQYRYIRNFFPERPLLQPSYRDDHPTVKDMRRLHAEGKLTPLQDSIFFGVRPQEELYDIAKDVHQTNNLALDPKFKAELVRHREILDQWIKETDDKGQYPESDAEMRAQVRFWRGRTVNPEFDKYEAELEAEQATTLPDGVVKPAPAPLPQVKLTDLTPVNTRVGWGDLRFNKNNVGNAISVEGKKYTSGIFAHAPSELEYKLDPRYARFVAGMGIDDSKNNGSVIFKVKVGDTVLAESPVIESGLTWYFDVQLPNGQQTIRLIAEDAGDGQSGDHSVWVDAGFNLK